MVAMCNTDGSATTTHVHFYHENMLIIFLIIKKDQART